MRIRVYTDGACSGNPGPGGWAAIFTVPNGYKQLSGHDISTTNNRMELTAAIMALEHLAVAEWSSGVDKIDVHSDSAYVVNAINNNWIALWESKAWTTQKGTAVKNKDLWQKMLDVKGQLEERGVLVRCVKVKGHAGNTLNEMVDRLAVEASTRAQSASAESLGRR